jgi:hypothetical protein
MLTALRILSVPAIAITLLAGCQNSFGDDVPDDPELIFAHYTGEGDLAGCTAALEERLTRVPDDEATRFALGMSQFLQAVEGLTQSQFQYGLMHHADFRPLVGVLPIEWNENPEPISYDDARQIVREFHDRLATVEETLGAIDTTDVLLQVHFGRIKLDINGDGVASEGERFYQLFRAVNPAVTDTEGVNFKIRFDGGDVHWLKGYCHFLQALCDFALAHDFREIFERCGHMIYPEVESPYEYLAEEIDALGSTPRSFEFRSIADVVAFIHLINFEVVEPDRLKSCHAHLLSMVEESRLSWERILAEKDDELEWLPGPAQTSVIPVRVSREMITGWHTMLDEIEMLLTGEKLVPFWRGAKPEQVAATGHGRGVNLQRVFNDPRRFDLVLWVSGTAAQPYLEEGDVTTFESWDRLLRLFGGEFFGFAFWFN